MHMKSFLRRLVLSVAAVAAVACVSARAAAAGTPVKVGYNQWIGFAQAYVAKD